MSFVNNDKEFSRIVIVDCDGVKNYDFVKDLKSSDSVILVGDKSSEVNACAMMSLISVGCKLEYREFPVNLIHKLEFIVFLLGQLSNTNELMLVTENCVLNGIAMDLPLDVKLVYGDKRKNDLFIEHDDIEDDSDIETVDVPNIQDWKGTLATQYKEMME